MSKELVNQPTKRTARKVRNAAWTAAWIAPASTIAATLTVSHFPVLADDAVQVQALFSFAATGAGTWIVGYFTRERLENML